MRSPTEIAVGCDWNRTAEAPSPPRVELLDETLRDGLQSPSVAQPALEDKLELLELMARAGIRAANLGLPAVSPRVFEDVVALARHAGRQRLGIDLGCAARTSIADVVPIVEACQATGQPIEACLFIGSSPIRLWTEGWTKKLLLERTETAVAFAVRQGLEVAYVTEDTTRSAPPFLEELFRCALDHGARRLVLCDTVGHATPDGTRALVAWTRALLEKLGAAAKIDWHGHDDRGLALANAVHAFAAGADRVHACALGMGERVGNPSMDLLLYHLHQLGWIERDGAAILAYARKASEATGIPIPKDHPLVTGRLGSRPRPLSHIHPAIGVRILV